MDTRDGTIHQYEEIPKMAENDRRYMKPMTLVPTSLQMKRGRVGRNDPCPCGSGKKFKRCCFVRV